MAPPYCTLNPPAGKPSDCGLTAGATIYFVTFVIAISYLLTNLFVAAILEQVFNKNTFCSTSKMCSNP